MSTEEGTKRKGPGGAPGPDSKRIKATKCDGVLRDFDSFDPEKHIVWDSKVKRNKHGLMSIGVKLVHPDTGKPGPFLVQGAKVAIPFGIQLKKEFEKDKKPASTAPSTPKYLAPLGCPGLLGDVFAGADSFRMKDESPESEARLKFWRFLHSVEESAVKWMVKNKNEFFNKGKNARPLTDDMVIGNHYLSLYNAQDMETYGPTLKTLRMRQQGPKITTAFFKPNGKPMDVSEISGYTMVAPILQFTGIWINSASFGLYIYLEQAVVFPFTRPSGLLVQGDFMQEDDEEEEEEQGDTASAYGDLEPPSATDSNFVYAEGFDHGESKE
nr:hypothetical protein [Sicyoidochytrium minutum DNA virus]